MQQGACKEDCNETEKNLSEMVKSEVIKSQSNKLQALKWSGHDSHSTERKPTGLQDSAAEAGQGAL
jgi:hypothetical protein